MNQSRRPGESPYSEALQRRRDRAVGFLVVEAIAAGIAVVTPITPSKTGSTWSPAHLFSPDPTYVEQVMASFVLVNLLLLALGLLVWLISKRSSSD
jgi:hypothetical protein